MRMCEIVMESEIDNKETLKFSNAISPIDHLINLLFEEGNDLCMTLNGYALQLD